MTRAAFEPLVLRPAAVVRWLAPSVAVLALAVTLIVRSFSGLALTALLAVLAWRELRISTTVDQDGLTVRRFRGTTRLTWSEIAGFATKGTTLLAVTPSQKFVLLEGADIRGLGRARREHRLAAVLSDLNARRPAAD